MANGDYDHDDHDDNGDAGGGGGDDDDENEGGSDLELVLDEIRRHFGRLATDT